MSVEKWQCTECHHYSDRKELLSAPSPFDPSEMVTGCPTCKAVNTQEPVCDEPRCKQIAGCGTPTPQGYRWTCGDHYPGKTK